MEAYRRYGPALLRKGQRLLGNRSDAEDVVQGLFADLVSRGEGTMDLPYLYRALTNRCLNLLRDASNHQRLLARHDVALRGEVRTRCDDQVIGVDLLVKLLGRLDPKATEVLVYRYFDDLTQDEIAELLATSRKTVGKRLDQIRAAVRALMGQEGA
ncbi:MAG: RNA polymerase sigma factor [Deltaproteobacteria bacterium]|nr:RNA polymerase sigma factor [Deltaproteobacteria bacterium]